MKPKHLWLVLFLFAFLFRLGFGLLRSQIWEIDQKQTYLIGLKCYTTGTWPYFGPDVNGAENTAFQSQIPGALEGLLIGIPFYLLPIPEAPFILLNLLSAAGVALLAWYIQKKIPSLSVPWLLLWITIAPWSLHEASTIINPAFTFLPAVLFFIGFMESAPPFSLRILHPGLANALMGFSLFWIMQFHFSYVYLLPLAGLSLLFQLKEKRFTGLLYFFLGCLPTLAFILPTYLVYGLAKNNVASGFTVPFNWANVREGFTILARYFSLACFELPRFIGVSTKSRLAFLGDHPLLALPGGLLWILGLLQPFVLLFAWFQGGKSKFKNNTILTSTFARRYPLLSTCFKPLDLLLSWIKRGNPLPGWAPLRILLIACFLMVFASFWFTVKMPLSHIYFVLFPFLMAYSCYVWASFAPKAHWRVLAKAFLILGLFFQGGYALAVAPKDSIYPGRAVIQKAIDEKNYHLYAERRPGSLY